MKLLLLIILLENFVVDYQYELIEEERMGKYGY